MTAVNTHDAKTHFSALLHRVEQGEEIIIARNGKPIARLVPFDEEAVAPPPRRQLGIFKHLIVEHPGWDDPMTDEELAEWYGPPFTTNDGDTDAR